MLAKLLKYEFKSTARIFLPFYLGVLILSALTGIGSFRYDATPHSGSALMQTIFPTLLAISFVGLGIITIITVVKRFDSNLLSDEGYLMFTLPVRISQLINSKIIISLVWSVLTGLVFLLSMFLVFREEFYFSELIYSLKILFSQPYAFTNTVFILVASFLTFCSFLLMVYASLSISQAYSITKSRILGGVLVFILLSIIFSVIQNIGVFIIRIFLRDNFYSFISFFLDNGSILTPISLIFMGYIFLECVLLYYLTHYHLKNMLNLD